MKKIQIKATSGTKEKGNFKEIPGEVKMYESLAEQYGKAEKVS